MNDQLKNVNLERQAQDLGVDPQALAAFVAKQQKPKELTEADLAAKAKELGVDQADLAEFLVHRKKAQGTKEDLLAFAEEAGVDVQALKPVFKAGHVFSGVFGVLMGLFWGVGPTLWLLVNEKGIFGKAINAFFDLPASSYKFWNLIAVSFGYALITFCGLFFTWAQVKTWFAFRKVYF